MSNPVKRKRKKNPAQRITDAMLDRRVDLLNQVLGRPEKPWTKKPDGGMVANIGNLHISGAYGGVSLHEMMNQGGGVNDISQIGYVPKRELYNFINGMLATAEFRKKNPITPGQLENFVYELDGSGKEELQGALKVAVDSSKDFSIPAAKRKIYKDLATLLRKELKKFDPSRNPKGRKTMRKKKRSAKQLANDKRLGRMAKARAKAKRGGRRKITKKKTTRKKKTTGYGRLKRSAKPLKYNPKPTFRKSKGSGVYPKLRVFNIFKCYGKSVRFLGLTTAGKLQWTIRDASISWRSQKKAAGVARKLAKKSGMAKYDVGVAASGTSSSKIAAHCKAGN